MQSERAWPASSPTTSKSYSRRLPLIGSHVLFAGSYLGTSVFAVLSKVWWLGAGLVLLSAGGLEASVSPAPYLPDLQTVFLFHLDEPSGVGVATNSSPVTAGLQLIAFDGNPFAGDGVPQDVDTTVLGTSGSTGFGNCANLSAGVDLGLGLDANQDGTFVMDDGSPVSNDRLPTHLFFSPSNTFTLEALINVSSIANGNQEIISTDNGSASSERGLQFRISSTGELQFNFVGVLTSAVSVPIPTNGLHAFVPDQWFHAAIAYDGSNAWFYWTRLDSGVELANQIGGPLAEGVDVSDNMLLVIGNEGRAIGDGTGSTEGLSGLIDEVRISSVARGPNEFVFRSISILEASSFQDVPGDIHPPEDTLDEDLNTRWSAQGDGQWITYDLGRVEIVEAVAVAFYVGDTRTTTFDVLLSNDNSTWLPGLTGAISSGATLSLESFDFPDFPARYIRIVGHGNSLSDWNSLTEVEIQSSLPADTDHDGLPDLWEEHYFSDLDETALSDPDMDTLSNFYELHHGLNPTEPDALDDTDNDQLPDSWEEMWFGNLDQTAQGDPDRDGVSNLAEWENQTNPTNPNSVPGDADGDSLPDDWELNNLGGLSYWAYEDPDNDGYNNVAERIGNTSPTNAAIHPSWKSPRVALLNDSIVTNTACLMPSASTYGRAINGVSFQNLPVSFNGYQYIAWYDTQGSDQSLWLGRRTIDGVSMGEWEMFDTGSNFTRGDENSWDAHNVIALGIAHDDGSLHFSWDHHGQSLRYRRSVAGICTTNLGAWGPAAFYPEQDWLVTSGQTISSVTYPRFFNTPTGELQFVYRSGSTSAGEHWLHNYTPATGNWTPGRKFATLGGTFTGLSLNGGSFTSTSRNAYENGYSYASDGSLHYTWTYREATSNPSNHDIDYAYSTDGGVTWHNNSGALIIDTDLGEAIRVDTPGIIVKVIDSRQRLINQQAQCVDNDGRVHVLMLHRRVEPGFEWVLGDSAFSTEDTAYYHYYRDPATGVWSQRRLPVDIPVGSRPKIGFDSEGNVYAVFVGGYNGNVVPGYSAGNLVVASASKESEYTDWEVQQIIGIDFNGEPLIDQARLLADNILSVFIQEDGPASSSAIGTPLHVLDFAVGVSAPGDTGFNISIDFLEDDVLILVHGESGYSYQLRSTMNLAPASWADVGSSVSSEGSLLALPDPAGLQSDARFYVVARNAGP